MTYPWEWEEEGPPVTPRRDWRETRYKVKQYYEEPLLAAISPLAVGGKALQEWQDYAEVIAENIFGPSLRAGEVVAPSFDFEGTTEEQKQRWHETPEPFPGLKGAMELLVPDLLDVAGGPIVGQLGMAAVKYVPKAAKLAKPAARIGREALEVAARGAERAPMGFTIEEVGKEAAKGIDKQRLYIEWAQNAAPEIELFLNRLPTAKGGERNLIINNLRRLTGSGPGSSEDKILNGARKMTQVAQETPKEAAKAAPEAIELRISQAKTLDDVQALRAELSSMPRAMGRSINEIALSDIERAIKGQEGITVSKVTPEAKFPIDDVITWKRKQITTETNPLKKMLQNQELKDLQESKRMGRTDVPTEYFSYRGVTSIPPELLAPAAEPARAAKAAKAAPQPEAPPIKPPEAPPTAVAQPMPEKPSIRMPTIQEIEDRSKLPTPEERGSRPRNIENAAYVPNVNVEQVANKLIVQTQKLAPDNLQKLQQMAQGIPGLRELGHILEPAGAAVARAAARRRPEDIIPKLFVDKDIYNMVEGGVAEAAWNRWMGTWAKEIELNNLGYVSKKVARLKPEFVDKVNPKIAGRLDDIIENPKDYIKSSQLEKAIQEITQTEDALLQAQQLMGIDLRETKINHIARIVTKFGGKGLEVGGPSARKKARTFRTLRELYDAGGEAMNPTQSISAGWRQGVENISNRYAQEAVKDLGETAVERRARAAPVFDAYKVARAEYKDARATFVKAQSGVNTAKRALANAKKPETTQRWASLLSERQRVLDEATARVNVAEPILSRTKYTTRVTARQVGKAGVGEVEYQGRIFPKEVIAELDKYWGSAGSIGDFVDEATRMIRGSMVTGDFSQLLVQGANLIVRQPHNWWKAAFESIASTIDSSRFYDYFVKNSAEIWDGTREGVITPPIEFLLSAGGEWSQRLLRIPGVKQTQQIFGRFIFYGQTEYWKSMKGIEKYGVDKAELAAAGRKMMGVILRPGLTRGEKTLESLTFFAPRFTGAMTTMFTDAARGGVRGAEARKTLGAVFAGATAMTAGINYALNGKLPNYFDPSANDWASITVPGGRVNLYGPYYPYMKAFARSSQAIIRGEEREAAEALTFFFRGKTSATIGPLIDFLTGSTAVGAPVENVGDMVANYVTRLGPIAPRQIAQHLYDVWQGKAEFQPSVLGEMAGLRTTPWAASQIRDRLREQYATSKGYDTWQITPSQTKRELEQTYDDLAKWTKAAQLSYEQKATGDKLFQMQHEREFWDNYQQQRQEFYTAQEQDDLLRQQGKISANQWTDRYRQRGAQIGQLATSGQFQIQMSKEKRQTWGWNELPIPREDELVSQYYLITPDEHMNEVGEVDWDEFFTARDKFLKGLSPQDKTYVEVALTKWQTPYVQQFKAAQTILKPYWKVEDQLWARVPNLKALNDKLQLMMQNPKTQLLAIMINRNHKGLSRIRSAVTKLRKFMRVKSKTVDNALVQFYGLQPIVASFID